VNGKPTLSLAEQRRRAAEIVEAAGVNNTAQIKQSVLGLTFGEQAEAFLKYSQTKNDPISTNTAYTWRTTLDKWLLPNIGGMLLADVKNKTLRDLVEAMVKGGLAPKSIDNYIGLVKLVVASAVDDEGEQIYPRKWNADFINAPKVKKQHKPSFEAEGVTDIIARAKEQNRLLLLLVAATGLRLGELSGLSVEDVMDGGATITVRQQATRGGITDRLKTKNAYRIVDVHSSVAAELAAFIGTRTNGLLFATSKGTAYNPQQPSKSSLVSDS
jgi:integrase